MFSLMKICRKANRLQVLTILAGLGCASVVTAVDRAASGTRICYADYGTDGKLRFVLYGMKGNIEGTTGTAEGVLINVLNCKLRKVDDIRNYHDLAVYAINKNHADVMRFWEDKPFSDYFLSTPNVEFDRSTKVLSSNKRVRFRSRPMDVDGVGFEVDGIAKTIHIRSKVRVVLRASMATRKERNHE